tara:strand:+ start:350 stop:856 length:507 start_codon:yes stop_codon:yes gene_type:complete
MKSNQSHQIKKRTKSNDVFLTPIELVKKHIEMIDYNPDDIWYDPFKNTGNYFNNYPTDNKEWSEILQDKDFFTFNKPVDIICSNPPYSMINEILKKSVELKPRIISYLIGMGNLTTKRIEYMNENGYGLKKIKMVQVHSWYGMSFIVHFEKDCENCIEFDRKIYHEDK